MTKSEAIKTAKEKSDHYTELARKGNEKESYWLGMAVAWDGAMRLIEEITAVPTQKGNR